MVMLNVVADKLHFEPMTVRLGALVSGVDLRETLLHARQIVPVRRGLPAVQQAGMCQNKGAGAVGHEPRAAGMSGGQRIQQVIWRCIRDVAPARDNDCVGIAQGLQPMVR